MLDWHGNSAPSWRTSPSLDISSQVRLTEVSLFFYTNHCCFIITSNYYSFFRSIFFTGVNFECKHNQLTQSNMGWLECTWEWGSGGVGEWGGDMIYLESSMGWEFMTTFGGCLILEWVQWDDVTYFWLPNANKNQAKVSLSIIIHFRLVMHRTSPLELNR